MLEGGAHAGTFVTASRCRLLKLFREDFHRLETANPSVAARIRATVGQQKGGSTNM